MRLCLEVRPIATFAFLWRDGTVKSFGGWYKELRGWPGSPRQPALLCVAKPRKAEQSGILAMTNNAAVGFVPVLMI